MISQRQIPLFAEDQDANKTELLRNMDSRAEHFKEVSRRIWDYAELRFEEFKSAALLMAELQAAGFQIKTNIAGIPTAFIASWGEGKPVVGLLGEYDALPELYQEAVPEKQPANTTKSGHGCGHNLLGTATAFAAITTKQHIESKKLPGTIRFYGCPAEENGAGKVFMVRAGAFADCDVALTWHPDDANEPGMRSTLANQSAYFQFHGTAAHAGRSPEKGRSALDAVMVMTHAVELLREHVPQETRIHYIITKGGTAVNIVPDLSEVHLVVRHPDSVTLDKIWARILKCAEAGALATETRLAVDPLGGLANVVPNEALAALFDRNMQLVGGVHYSSEERAFAEKLRKTMSPEDLPPLDSAAQVRPIQTAITSWSTDVGDVSWIVPTGEIRAAAFVPGVAAHTWQSTACAGMGIGQKGMLVAAKTLALTAIDLFADPKQVQAARESFEKRLAGRKYVSKFPPDAKPRINPIPAKN
ncbi:MAG: amidohydrolase [Verrucomicrobia bacterium]|nr:amidohydrolase [Verrucomicrobiota bacterium]